MYGTTVPSYVGRNRSVVGRVERTMSGNVVITVGREHQSGWMKTEHVTLTPDEAMQLVGEIEALAQ